MIFFLPEDKK